MVSPQLKKIRVVNLDHFPKDRGENKNYLKPPPCRVPKFETSPGRSADKSSSPWIFHSKITRRVHPSSSPLFIQMDRDC